ncbi:MAG: hypothetical protein GY941_05240 [Planctomycetes bacterium]|nr:hypothetical protein [Planctomycetota bacterium]
MMDYTLFKDNLDRIINRGGHGNRTVSVDVLKRCKAVIEDNEALTRKLEAMQDDRPLKDQLDGVRLVLQLLKIENRGKPAR